MEVNMSIDSNQIEKIVEAVTREVLQALAGQGGQDSGFHGRREYADEICVETRFDNAGQVINAGVVPSVPASGEGKSGLNIAAMIDHTALKPDTTTDQIIQLCSEARQYGFASVCVNPGYVKLCADLLRSSTVKVCTVIGFPLGATSSESKAYETKIALRDGATEIDMVINVGALKSGDLTQVASDIHGVVVTAHSVGAIVKVIIETSLLTREEKVKACLLAKETGADFVKTSTGFSGGGATVEDIALMRRVVGPGMGVKASGGVRTFEDAKSMIDAGATRIGASAGIKIVEGAKGEIKEPADKAGPKDY
jgi:deoxyribose-phosphate aldolase